ncbi:hypothetical protein GUITHDRAFT_109969 [Guillardia theta CCMP2712]|uniref:Helicase n=1 Tax=Guillardia theta (strain CCMP2712) TaxID=905079 RepID=L1J7V7_GUITC|nr:hypothetical protein GUITHDRAFT_109969 [Guillardia theta CCMP2712]EKX44184.1 hypothetical protein GUITHDRAFT_109969 [Guillardia theta CCMP2712]|eukprot:XP_005831164.1 hypothetical protein GUITHDRAFT_109969 [Guillardia theta CCMP2712]
MAPALTRLRTGPVGLEAEASSMEEPGAPWNIASLSGTPEVVDALRSKFRQTGQITTEELASCFPFPVDEFQMDAIRALIEKRSVIVSAPTGSGKTVCGEAAVYLGSAMGKKVLYTTPLKALSNQKFSDFCKQFGKERVGLLTGDVSVNRDNATILVLTTEVYRNMLYDSQDTVASEVHSVILDEFHYMNDESRGTVWEESVIHSPPEILLVALSATMKNVKDIRDWFAHVHGPTDLITSDFRPVPLQFKFIDRKGILNLFDNENNKKGQPRLNRLLLPSAAAAQDPRKKSGGSSKFDGWNGKNSRRSYESGPRRRREGGGGGGEEFSTPSGEGSSGRKRGGGSYAEIPSYGFAVRQLQKREMLPAIIFIFSRAQRFANDSNWKVFELLAVIGSVTCSLLLQFVSQHKEVAQEDRIRLALRGIASHHAGLVPLWKALVEELFQDGLIKVVFATETLAAGINMPARTTVISSLSKRTSDGVTSLTSNELRQMCGRAGRRGKDTVGHSVIMRSKWEGAPEAFTLVMKDADPLRSKFSPKYGMVLNLLQDRPIQECKKIVERSFGSFLASIKRRGKSDGAEDVEMEVQAAQDLLATVEESELQNFAKLTQRLKTEQRVLRILLQQAQERMNSVFEDTLPYCSPGTPLLLTPRKDATDNRPESAVLLGLLSDQLLDISTPNYFVCLTSTNDYRVVTPKDIVDVDLESEPVSMVDEQGARVDVNELIAKISSRSAIKRASGDYLMVAPRELAAIAARFLDRLLLSLPTHSFLSIPVVEEPKTPPEVLAQQDRVNHVEALLTSHPLFAREDRKELLRAYKFISDQIATGRLRQKATEVTRHDLLRDFGFLVENNVTDVGKLVASLNADNSLWVGSVLLYNDILYELGPHELAAALSCVVSDLNRPDIYIAFDASPKVQDFVEQASDMQSRVIASQLANGLTFEVPLDPSFAGLVEAWALGTSWNSLLAMTSMQEGDVIRVLRRVLDILRQIPRLPYVPGERGVGAEIRLNARRALTLMDRFPVSDDLTYSIELDERLEDESMQVFAQGMEEMRTRLIGKSGVSLSEDEHVRSEQLKVNVGWEETYEVDADENAVMWPPLSSPYEVDEDLGYSTYAQEGILEGMDEQEQDDEEEDEEDEEDFKVSKKKRAAGEKDDEDWIRGLGLGKGVESLPGDLRI